ncbi:MAG: NUDIX hydrolase [Candidatus Bilamarchaeaceae archaeon]
MRDITYPEPRKNGSGIMHALSLAAKRGFKSFSFDRKLAESRRKDEPLGSASGVFVATIMDDCTGGRNLQALLVQRSFLVYPWSGLHMLGASGKVREDERPVDAAVREVWEKLACSISPEKYEAGILAEPVALKPIPFDSSPALLSIEGYPFVMLVKPDLFEVMQGAFNRDEIRDVSTIFQPQLVYENEISLFIHRMLLEKAIQPHFRLVLEDPERSQELILTLNRLLYTC